MTSKEAIDNLANMLGDVKVLQKVKGQATLVKKIRGSMQYLRDFKVSGTNIPHLMYKECNSDMHELEMRVREKAKTDNIR